MISVIDREALFCDETMQALLGYPAQVEKINGTYYLQVATESFLVDLLK